ncbi:hypothetical protein [Thioalkalivibrio paradoxus]|uniref:Scaffold protein FimL second domain-containing protein n=1 Tax=Thioalkalivibrio paradoxus ARh 1 TaxID=713585 RepID=W0DTH9_9GAMM|nr:hypothetical protein [Thioalkalivibrio paradoxus]AHF00294.1 hypothetical protein THITH_15975 [Thioalkalivibrio paradoxus ARh 1]
MTTASGTWTRGELDDLFFWIQRALQKYVENAACGECLRLAGEGLGQVQASLEGAGRGDIDSLCAEMLHVIAALETDDIAAQSEAGDVLLRAALRIPGQLETTETSVQQRDRAVAPLVNELRALRGAAPRIAAPEPRIAEPELFTPRLVDPGAPSPAAAQSSPLQQSRRRFQQALLDLLRDRDPPATLLRLAETAAGVARALPDGDGRALFDATGELAAALVHKPGSLSVLHKQLFGRVDRELGQWLRRIEQAPAQGRPFSVEPVAVTAELIEQTRDALDRVTGAAPQALVSAADSQPAAEDPGGAAPVRGGPAAGPPGVRAAPGDSIPKIDPGSTTAGGPAVSDAGPDASVDGSVDASVGTSGGAVGGKTGTTLPNDRAEFDEGRLLGPVGAGAGPLPGGELERLAAGVVRLEQAFGEWRAAPSEPGAMGSVAAGFRALREDAEATAAPRLGEFAWLLESFLATLAAEGRVAGAEPLQVVDDAVHVLPELLAEIREDRSPDTPVIDIVLRIQAIRDQPPLPAEEDDPVPDAAGEPDLERIRRKGAEDMARLAAAFAALDGDDARASAEDDEPVLWSPAEVQAARAKLSELASWHQHAVAALTQAAGQLGTLEQLLTRMQQAPGSAAPSEGDADPETRECLDLLEQARLGLAGAIGNASAALLQQRRATQALQDRLDTGGGE